MKAGGFPLLIPGHFLENACDLRNNAGPSSYAQKAAKGVKPGAKISPRSPTSLLPSWNEMWMKVEDWIPVPKGQEDILWWGLGAGFCAQYGHPLKVVVNVDEMASSYGASRSMQMEQVNMWLTSLECASIPLPDTIEFINAYGCVDKMIQLPPKQTNVNKKTYKKSALPVTPCHKPFALHMLHACFPHVPQ